MAANTGVITCRNHPERAATIRCDECGRLYCRECVSERWLTSRSSVWVCGRCAGTWRPTAGSSTGLGGVHLGDRLSAYLPLGAVVGLALLVAVAQSSGFFGR